MEDVRNVINMKESFKMQSNVKFQSVENEKRTIQMEHVQSVHNTISFKINTHAKVKLVMITLDNMCERMEAVKVAKIMK